jgi:hypothetical protein
MGRTHKMTYIPLEENNDMELTLESQEISTKQQSGGMLGPSPCWPLVVSFGGGTNSAAMLIEMTRRGVKPDLIMFADTGGELPETYQFVRDFSKWLTDRGMPEVTWVRYERETLEANCIRQQMLPSLAYGFKGCSQKYKIQPQEKYANNWQRAKDVWKAGGKVVKLIGYDAGKHHRAKIPQDAKYIYAYPLVEWGWGRKECVAVVKSAGFQPAKSACFFCPAAKKWEVLSLAKTHPDLMERALEMERNAKCETVKGLGRNWRWEDLVKADEAQIKLFDDLPDMVPCGCYDGGASDSLANKHISQ